MLVWSDEFDTNGPFNANKWQAVIGPPGVNNEAEYYTANNANVNNGYLTIQALKQNIGTSSYTSSRLVSKQGFRYGIFEARIKVPKVNK